MKITVKNFTRENTVKTQTKTESITIKTPRRNLLSAVSLILLSTPLATTTCKSTSNRLTKVKSAEETQSDIKSEISDVLLKPAQTALTLLEPIAKQFKSIQELKAAADGAIQQADTWARHELESARARHRDNAILWDVAKIFAGPDGLLNYRDVKNTLACTPDSELKGIIQLLLSDASQKSSGYTKDGILLLIKHIQTNAPLPAFRSTFNPFGFLNEQQRPAEVRNEINRQISRTFTDQCLVPKDQIHSIGAFDLIKKYCINALDLRSQGILAGVLNLHYESASIDKPSSCEGRVLTQKIFQDFHRKYIAQSSRSSKNDPNANKVAADYLRIQTAKYFGPFETNSNTINLYEPSQDFFTNQYLQFPVGAQATLRGGLPVATVKKLMDDFTAGKNNLLVGNLGQIGKSFKTNLKCQALSSKLVPTKTSQPQNLDFTYYKDEDEFRAYFDPDYDGEKYFKTSIQNRENLRRAIEDSRVNKSNALLKRIELNGATSFFHQSLSHMNFLGASGSSLTKSRFSKLTDGRVRLDSLYLENASDGEFSVVLQRVSKTGGFELVEFEGYSIPYAVNNSSVMTPCLEFTAQ
jgi:hypothetical protein